MSNRRQGGSTVGGVCRRGWRGEGKTACLLLAFVFTLHKYLDIGRTVSGRHNTLYLSLSTLLGVIAYLIGHLILSIS